MINNNIGDDDMRTRLMLILVIVASFVLGACATTETPTEVATEEVSAPTDEPNLSPTAQVIIVTRDPDDDPLNILQVSEATEDPDPTALFETLRVVRVGGGEGVPTIELDINQDGTFTRNGVQGILAPEDIIALDTLVDEIQFFNIEGDMSSISRSDTDYVYYVTINATNGERTIESIDNRMPPAYKSFVAQLLQVGL